MSLEEVHEILSDTPRKTGSGEGDVTSIDEAGRGDADKAAKLIDSGDQLVSEIQGGLKRMEKEFKQAKRDLDGLRRAGAGTTEAVKLLKKPVEKLKQLKDFVDMAHSRGAKAAGMRESLEEAQTVLGADNVWYVPQQDANVAKSRAYFDLKRVRGGATTVKLDGVSYRVAQPPVALGGSPGAGAVHPSYSPDSRGHVLTLVGSKYPAGTQYALLVPPDDATGTGGTVRLVDLGSANPRFRDVSTAKIEDTERPSDKPTWASPAIDDTKVWVECDGEDIGPIIAAVYSGEELSHHIDERGSDPEHISKMREIAKAGRGSKVEGTRVDPHMAANVIRIYDGLSVANQRKLGSMGLSRMMDVAKKMGGE